MKIDFPNRLTFSSGGRCLTHMYLFSSRLIKNQDPVESVCIIAIRILLCSKDFISGGPNFESEEALIGMQALAFTLLTHGCVCFSCFQTVAAFLCGSAA